MITVLLTGFGWPLAWIGREGQITQLYYINPTKWYYCSRMTKNYEVWRQQELFL